MNLLIKLSLRYLLSVRGSTLIISLIAFVGISLSVSAVLLTMGAFSGFQKALKEKILATTPHIIVSSSTMTLL
jgi:lipoprotein-releasing system permease protein